MRPESFNLLLILIAACMSLSQSYCVPEFKPNFVNLIRLSYPIYQGKINKLWLSLTDNGPLVELLTPECKNVINLRVDYRIVGQEDWKSFTGRRGVIALHKKSIKIQKIDSCAKYELKIAAMKEHGGGEVVSEMLKFGPYYKQLSKEEIKLLGPDSMPDISSSIVYSNVNSSGFTVSWGKICAQSLNIYLLTGPEFRYGNIINTLTDILRNNVPNSMWVTARPCSEYKIAIESFMTAEPLSMENSVDHKARETVSTTPGLHDLVKAELEEAANFKVFSWSFMDHSACLSDQRFEIFLISQAGEEKKTLRSGDWTSEHGEIDLSSYRSTICSDVELLMKVNYTTKSGTWNNDVVFNQTISTNELGQFAQEGSNNLSIGQEIINVTFGSCEKEAVVRLVDTLNDIVGEPLRVFANASEILPDILIAYTKPCEKYKIQLVSSKDDMHLFDQQDFPTKEPNGNVTFELSNTTTKSFTFEILDIEENENCQVKNYKVKCKEQAEIPDKDDANDSVEKAWMETVTVKSNTSSSITISNLSSQTEFLCQAHIIYGYHEGNTSVIVNSSRILAKTNALKIVEKIEDVPEVAANVDKTQKLTLIAGVIAIVLLVLLIIIVSGLVYKSRSNRRDSLHVSEAPDYKPV